MTYELSEVNNVYLPKINFDKELLKKFIDFVDVNEITIKAYKNQIKYFLKWLNDNQIQNPKRQDIKDYKLYLSKQDFATGTKQQYFRAVKQLFKWLSSEGLYNNISDNIKGFKINVLNKKESFNESDIRKIISDIDITKSNGLRDKSIILLMLTGGLRVSEVSNIDIKDIEILKGQMICYIKGKGHHEKDTYIKIIDKVAYFISEYLKTRNNTKPNQPLFTSNSNRVKDGRLTPDTISRICKKRFKNSGYISDKLTSHSLRHTSNTLLFKSGADLFKVQKHARHQDPKTTEIYLHINDRDKDTSEQDIYNQIYNIKSDKINTLMTDINNLSDSDKKILINKLILDGK